MDSNRFIVFPVVLLLAKKHSSSLLEKQAEEDVVFSENANMFVCYFIPNAYLRVSMRLCREGETTEARARRE